MTRTMTTLGEVIDGLRAEKVMDETKAAQADALVEKLRATTPWYVRAMMAMGAWSASLMLIVFVGLLFFMAMGGDDPPPAVLVIVGLAMMFGALYLRKQSSGEFAVQFSLAVSLAGQAVLALALAIWVELANVEMASVVPLVCCVILVVNVVLFFVFPDSVHRTLSVLFADCALVVLLAAKEWYDWLAMLGPALAILLVAVWWKRAELAAAGHGRLVRPLMTGLMLSAFACLLLSVDSVWPLWAIDEFHYPSPWISSLLLGGLFLLVGSATLKRQMAASARGTEAALYLLMVAVVVTAWSAPGIFLALVVLLLGAAGAQPTLRAAGIVFLALFVGAYFYSLETTMLMKSVTLIATGACVLVARGVLRWLFAPDGKLARAVISDD